ncbi:hypothetical protein APS60_09855 [Cutibacterium acnes]|uniref:Uncharacterized protein n=1 Tax=Cutibacterium acnes TaxID=1747 RepID=A0AA44ZE52_CUTAC|nr:hypothetical protein APS59_10415 [Cutibacterium acnes]PGF26202.1 hypothetical protein B1B02_09650 [Cutibacterium acnes subsp. defendens]PGF26513.1 hypothetical protein B1B08_09630 [Cutibacterium acnes subsp. defendens]PGF39072.1 hypothetical protein B1B14_10815 [Cutibacterium acnes subsp. defendens]PGF43871.1 hypothetical protein B1B12_10950 [Cutibacterium acnes subsp. defendens]
MWQHPRDLSLQPLARHLVFIGFAPGAILAFGWAFCAAHGANGSHRVPHAHSCPRASIASVIARARRAVST